MAVKPSGIQFKKNINPNFLTNQNVQESRNKTHNVKNCSAEKSTNPEVPEKHCNCIAMHNFTYFSNSSIVDTKTLTKQPGSQLRQGGVVGGGLENGTGQ